MLGVREDLHLQIERGSVLLPHDMEYTQTNRALCPFLCSAPIMLRDEPSVGGRGASKS